MNFNNYSNQIINGKKSIWLQYYGWCPAKAAKDFKTGDFMKWNTGSESKVIGIESETAKQITYIIEWKNSFKKQYETGTRKFNKDRLVAIGTGRFY